MIMVLAPHRAVKASAVAATASRGGPRDRAAEEPAAPAGETPAAGETAAAGETGTTAETSGQ